MYRCCKYLVFLVMVLLLAGCSDGDVSTINVYKPNDAGQMEFMQEVTDAKQVAAVKAILNHVVWEKAKVQMIRQPDFCFRLQDASPDRAADASMYSVWLSPSKQSLEILSGPDQYAKLDKGDIESSHWLLS